MHITLGFLNDQHFCPVVTYKINRLILHWHSYSETLIIQTLHLFIQTMYDARHPGVSLSFHFTEVVM